MFTTAVLEAGAHSAVDSNNEPKRRFIDLFDDYMTVVQANSKELLDSVFRLRFQVYCRERGFEDAASFPEGRERDEDDARSLHFLVVDRLTTAPVGTVRLILPKRHADLPVFRLIGAGDRIAPDLPLETTAEVSRFAIAKAYRRQLENALIQHLRAMSTDAASRLALPLLTFGLIRAVFMMTLAGGITHVVAMMEPALLRMLGRLGIEFNPIGEPVEHHGVRQPGWAAIDDLAERVKQCRPELWELALMQGGTRAGRRCRHNVVPESNVIRLRRYDTRGLR
jgi:N-acyl amino acid synthase of PEP-CTERM/exosortase system